jgi:hypothetical protein
MGLYGSYNGLTARISHAIVWFTTSLHQNFDLGFIFCACRDDFCYQIHSGCVDYGYYYTMLNRKSTVANYLYP